MSRSVFILGGYGVTGRLIAEKLLARSDVKLVLAGRNLGKAKLLAEDLNRQYPGERVRAVYADAEKPETLDAVLPGSDLLLIASGTSQFVLNTAQAALKHGLDYYDLQYSARKLQILKTLEGKITKAKLCFITDGGFHPGLPAVLVRYLEPEFERMERAVVGSVIRLNWKRYPITASTAREFIREFEELQCRVFKQGNWVKPPFWGMLEGFKMDYGEPFGQVPGFPMTLAELEELPGRSPFLQETGFYIAGFSFLVDWLIMPMVYFGLKTLPQKSLKPSAKLLFWGLKKFSVPPYETILQLEAGGKKAGREINLRLRVFHPDAYEFTAITVAAVLKQYLAGEIRKPGLWLQGWLAEPQKMLEEMREMGVGLVKEEFQP